MTEKIRYFIFNKRSDFDRGASENMVYSDKGVSVSEAAGADRGRYLSRVLDGIEEDTVWHRMMLGIDLEEAENYRLTFYTANAEETEWNGEPRKLGDIISDEDISFDEKLRIMKPYLVKQVSGQRDILLHDVKGRYFWFLLEAYGRNEAGVLSHITVYLPAVSWMAYLPQIYRTSDGPDGFLERYLAIFQTLYEELNFDIENAPELFDVDAAEKEFLELLSGWLALSDTYVWNTEQLRTLLRRAIPLYRMRGTKASLAEIVELYTGEKAYIIENFELQRFRERPEYDTILLPMYGSDPYTVICLVKEQDLGGQNDYNVLLKIAEEMLPAQMSLRLIPLKPYIFLDQFSYVGINSVLGQYRDAAFDGTSSITLTALGGERPKEEQA